MTPVVLLIQSNSSSWWVRAHGHWQRQAQVPAGPVRVLTDLTEENFAELPVPRIFGNDRRQFVARQLATRFPDTRFRISLKPHATDSFMDWLAPPLEVLTAINPDTRLTGVLKDLQAPLVGIWSTSLLLAHVAHFYSKALRLMVVLNQGNSLRIVFLKNRAPVLTRLITLNPNAQDQSVEIMRTVRHLENTRVVDRDADRLSLLLLGFTHELPDILRSNRLEVLDVPVPKGQKAGHADWQAYLFDQVCHNPPGQLAPPQDRLRYMASQAKTGVVLVNALCAAGAAMLLAGSGSDIYQDRRQIQFLQTELAQLDARSAQVDSAIGSFGVSPELLRKAIALDSDEIASAPDMATDLAQLSQTLALSGDMRLNSLSWQVLLPQDKPCADDSQAAQAVQPAAAAAAPAPTSTTQRRAMLQFSIAFNPQASPRQTLQSATQISQQLEDWPKLQLLQEPTRRLRDAELSSAASQQQATSNLLNWCAVVPNNNPSPSESTQP